MEDDDSNLDAALDSDNGDHANKGSRPVSVAETPEAQNFQNEPRDLNQNHQKEQAQVVIQPDQDGQAAQVLLRKLLSFAPPNFEAAKMSAKIEELGLGTLSDLKYVLDVEQCFLDVLKPVGVGKLKEFIDGMLFLQLNCVYDNHFLFRLSMNVLEVWRNSRSSL